MASNERIVTSGFDDSMLKEPGDQDNKNVDSNEISDNLNRSDLKIKFDLEVKPEEEEEEEENLFVNQINTDGHTNADSNNCIVSHSSVEKIQQEKFDLEKRNLSCSADVSHVDHIEMISMNNDGGIELDEITGNDISSEKADGGTSKKSIEGISTKTSKLGDTEYKSAVGGNDARNISVGSHQTVSNDAGSAGLDRNCFAGNNYDEFHQACPAEIKTDNSPINYDKASDVILVDEGVLSIEHPCIHGSRDGSEPSKTPPKISARLCLEVDIESEVAIRKESENNIQQ